MHLKEFFKKHVKDTPEKAIVADRKMFLCNLTNAVLRGIGLDDSVKSIYVTARAVKYMYDKKPAEEFDFIIDNLTEIVKYPDKIYKNLPGKRGDFCLIKKIKNEQYFCTIEITDNNPACSCVNPGLRGSGQSMVARETQIVTAFRLRKEKYDKYIKNYTLLWDWGNGTPHRSALDTPKESTSAPQ